MIPVDKPVIQLQNVSFTFNGDPVLRSVDLEIREREFVAIVGPNGSGKTTILKLILGLLHPTTGTVRVFGAPPERARPRLGYVPQYIFADIRFPVRVEDVVLMGRLGPQGDSTGREIARALVAEPDILLLDEPTASLDSEVAAQLYDLLGRMNARMTLILVSHDLWFVSRFVTRVVCVQREVQVHDTSDVDADTVGRLSGLGMRMVRHEDSCPGGDCP